MKRRENATMTDALDTALGDLVGDLERRFPYAAALLTGAAGIQISDNGAEQSASEVSPSRGVVFTVYDGAAFQEYATGELDPDQLAVAVRAWASTLAPRNGPPLATSPAADATPLREEFRVQTELDPAAVP